VQLCSKLTNKQKLNIFVIRTLWQRKLVMSRFQVPRVFSEFLMHTSCSYNALCLYCRVPIDMHSRRTCLSILFLFFTFSVIFGVMIENSSTLIFPTLW